MSFQQLGRKRPRLFPDKISPARTQFARTATKGEHAAPLWIPQRAASGASPRDFRFKIGDQTFLCSIGRNGISSDKKEGDGTTPTGEFSLKEIFYRADRINLQQLRSNLPCIALQKNDGWCDDVNSENYNKYTKLPSEESYEELWRDDNIYDIIIVIGYNDDPIIKGKGSAIFMHIARENYEPTAGCIALAKEDLLKVVPQLTIGTKVNIDPSGVIQVTQTSVNPAS